MEQSSWQQMREEFRFGAEAYPDLLAHWESREGLWTLQNAPVGAPSTLPDLEAQNRFKKTARSAVLRLGKSIKEEPPWQIWLDLMRNAKRGFRRILKPRTGGQFRRIIEAEGISDTSGIPLGDDGSIGHVFLESADFCEDLAAGAIELQDPAHNADSSRYKSQSYTQKTEKEVIIDFSDLPQASRDRIAAAEIEARSILANFHAQAHILADDAERLGIDRSGIGCSAGDIPLQLARQRFTEGGDEATAHLFGVTAREYIKHGRLVTEAFNAKLDVISNWISEEFHPDHRVLGEMKDIARAAALKWRAAALEAKEPVGTAPEGELNETTRLSNHPHTRFAEFLDCVATFAGQEALDLMRRGPAANDLWMLGGLPQFSEFKTSAGIEAVRKVWDHLLELKHEGRMAIRAALKKDLEGKYPEDRSGIIANAIWSCILLHGDRLESGQQGYKPEGKEPKPRTEGAAAAQAPGARDTAQRRAVVDDFLLRCNQEPGLAVKVIREHIWRSVGHKRARQFQYWQAEERRLPGTTRGATNSDDLNFDSILRTDPADFVASLKKKGLILAKS